jgi:hydroxymethylbilane synthase
MGVLIRIGTRSSQLAIAQASQVKDLLTKKLIEKEISADISIVTFKTTGDKRREQNLSEIGGKGLFTKELEEALIDHEIDVAVHSMKDVPTKIIDGLEIPSILKRSDPRDAFISKKYQSIRQIPQESVIGTSSARRKALLLNIRPDLKIVNFRGNVTTRLEKIAKQEVDGTILAASGLKRIRKDKHISSILSPDFFLPAVAQGAIGVQCRESDEEIKKIIRSINDKITQICIIAERSFLKKMDGSCHSPIASYCSYNRGRLKLVSLISSLDGKTIHKNILYGKKTEAKHLGEKAAEDMLKKMSLHGK